MGRGRGRIEENVQGIRSINSWYKIDKGRSRIVQDMEKPKNLYVQLMHSKVGECLMT